MIIPFIFAFWICVKLGGSPRIKGTTPVAGLVCSRCAISFLFGCDGAIAPCALGYRFSVLSATSYKTMEMLPSFNITTVFCQAPFDTHVVVQLFAINWAYSFSGTEIKISKQVCIFIWCSSFTKFILAQCNVVDMNVIFTFWGYICRASVAAHSQMNGLFTF